MSQEVEQKDSKFTQRFPENHEPMKKREYKQIDNWKRRNLINTIMAKKISIKEAAELLGIKYSAAKYIYKQYKKNKRIDVLPKKPNKEYSKAHEILIDSSKNQDSNKFAFPPIQVPNSSKEIDRLLPDFNREDFNIGSKSQEANLLNQSNCIKIQEDSKKMSSLFEFDFGYYKRSIIERYYLLAI